MIEFLWEFLKTILSDTIKDRLKPKGSSEIAKEKAFNLYKKLGEINQKTDDFIIKLQSFAELVDKEIPKEAIYEKRRSLELAVQDLMNALPELAEVLDEINPQIEIYQYELVQEIKNYRRSRDVTVSKLRGSVFKMSKENKTTIQQLVEQAIENRNLIHKAIDDFRIFLSKEFQFKESF